MAAPSAVSPAVELSFTGVAAPVGFATLKVADQTTEQALERALLGYRAVVIREARKRLLAGSIINAMTINYAVDTVWQVFLPSFGRVTVPFIARAYFEAYRKVGAGDVPPAVIQALAENYAERLGNYFHETSRESLIQGFNTYSNRRIAARAALDRVLDAYGLTPRQMAGYTSNKFDNPRDSAQEFTPNAMAKDYVAKSLRQRVKTVTDQEIHNISMEGTQTAWMWLAEQGRISARAEKVWLTAKDERVCATCGPLHGKRVKVLERFSVSDGQELYVPGVHVNCRCEVRLVDIGVIGKSEDFDPREHPRAANGRFRRKNQPADSRPFAEARPMDPRFQELLDQMFTRTQPREGTETGDKMRFSSTPENEPMKFSAQMRENKRMSFATPMAFDTPQEKITTSPGQKMSVSAGEKFKLSAGEKMKLHQDFIQAFKDMNIQMGRMEGELEAARQQRRGQPTVRLPHTVYAVAHWHELDTGAPYELNMDHETVFFSDEIQAAKYASDQIEINVENATNDIRKEFGGQVVTYDPDYGRLYAHINHEDIQDTVKFVARMAGQGYFSGEIPPEYGYDADWIGDAEIPITWTDGAGNAIRDDKIRYSQLASEWEIDEEDFEVLVFSMDEGWDDPESNRTTVMRESDSKHGQESWSTRGRYVADEDMVYQAQVGDGYRVMFLHIQPDVEHVDYND